ncbi:MAG: DUF3846 domain-containing protein [Patescibacteria group bacterium]|nr:DUF3846 domain-containing protein [Patescibacteria group bacterium]
MHHGIWYKANGEVVEVEPANRRKFSLDELSKFVGGYIECVRLTHGTMYVNEEGLLLNLPFNAKATELANADQWWAGQAYLVGDAIYYTGDGNKKE